MATVSSTPPFPAGRRSTKWSRPAPPPAARPAAQGAAGLAAAVKPNLVCLLAFGAGLSEAFTVQIFGRVYLVELILPAVALIVLALRPTRELWKRGVFWALVLGLLGLLLSYVVSDLARGTSPDQYLRGWGRALFIVSNVVSLAILIAADRRALWWFVAGVGLSGILQARLIEHLPLRSHHGWKFSYAPHVLLVVSALGGLLKPRLGAVAFGALAVYAMTLEGRTYSVLAAAVAGFLWLRGASSGRKALSSLGYLKLVLVAGVGAASIVMLLEHTETEWSAKRRASSDENRFALLAIGSHAILGSPILGYGSWSQHPDIAQIADEVLGDQGGEEAQYYGAGSTLMHSQLLQAWVEGGIGAGLFFLVYAYLLLRSIKTTAISRQMDMLSPVLFYLCANGLWHTFMSPFAATHRVEISMACAAIIALSLERAAAQKQARSGQSAPVRAPSSGAVERRPSRNGQQWAPGTTTKGRSTQ